MLVAALPAGADTSFTTTNWVAGVPVMGALCTNASSQAHWKGNVHVRRVVCADPRIAGRLTAWMDMAFQANGTATFAGPALGEVGTWDGSNFLPGDGVWQLRYNGVAQADGSDQVRMVGYGIGGEIGGLRVDISATKGPGAPFDPAIPYVSSGTITPAPMDTRVVLDDFNNGIIDNHWVLWCSGQGSWDESNGQLTVTGAWNRPANQYIDHAGAYWLQNWSVTNGQTREWRVEVVSLNQDASGVGFSVGTSNQRFYSAGLSSDRIGVDRWMAPGTTTPLFSDPVALRQTNIIFSFALTRRQSQAWVTIRVLDRANPDSVLYQRSFVDTAPYLNGDELALAVRAKPELLHPTASATFDNFQLLMYEVPQLSIASAVRILWPATGMNFGVEGAPTPQGPWEPIEVSVPPGFEQIYVPQDSGAKFFHGVAVP